MVRAPNSKDYVEHIQQQRLLQFLSGLNDSYNQARRQIMLKSNVPSINQAYAMVIEDESQHSFGLGSSTEKNDPMAMQVGRGQGYRGKKPFMQCEHSGLKGHTKENYYKIIGYPKDFKGKKKFGKNNAGGQFRRGNGNFGGQFGTQQSINAVNNVCGNADVQSQGSSAADLQGTLAGKGPYFTEEQYKQILGLLNKDTNDSQANMAGIATCLISSTITNEWIVDSGVTHHIAATENLSKDGVHARKSSKDKVQYQVSCQWKSREIQGQIGCNGI